MISEGLNLVVSSLLTNVWTEAIWVGESLGLNFAAIIPWSTLMAASFSDACFINSLR